MKIYIKDVVIIILLTMAFVSCEKSTDVEDEKQNLIFIASDISSDNSFEVELYAEDTLFEGYNKLFLIIKDRESMDKVSGASITFKPLMDMVDMKHAAPVENPPDVLNEDGYFEGAVVFIMPSTDMMGWTLGIDIEVGGKMETANLIIPVVRNLEEKRKINIISAIDETKYFVSLVEPVKPVVGMNVCEFTIHYKENMMSFPAAGDLIVEIEPEMPSMDHGSPNNEHPVHLADGHYLGKINFTMTGWWRVHMTMKKGDKVVSDEAFFDITLE